MARGADAADTSSTSNTALLPSARCGAGGSSLLYLIVAVASIGGLLFGYDTGVVSGAMIKLTPYFGMNTVMVEATVSSTVALAALGALCSGPANRLLGRRLVLIAAAVVFTAGAVLMALASTFAALIVSPSCEKSGGREPRIGATCQACLPFAELTAPQAKTRR